MARRYYMLICYYSYYVTSYNLIIPMHIFMTHLFFKLIDKNNILENGRETDNPT